MDEHGRCVRFPDVSSDVTDRKLVDILFGTAEEEREFVIALSSRQRARSDPEAGMLTSSEALVRRLGVSQVSVAAAASTLGVREDRRSRRADARPDHVRGRDRRLDGFRNPSVTSTKRYGTNAIPGFDTAPSGGVGNVCVLASEPDAAFEQSAIQAIYSAKVTENDVGHRDSIGRAQFKMP